MRAYRLLCSVAAFVLIVVTVCGCGGNVGAGVDAGECGAAADCEGQFGPAPCGAWECNSGACEVVCPDCDDADRDGYGVELSPGGCAGPDCDDNDANFHDSGVRQCYSGPLATEGVGTCRAGTETCTAGVLGPCVGEVLPSGEACNGDDDDCDGAADNGLGQISCGLGACQNTVNVCDAGVVQVCTPLAAAGNDAVCDMIDNDCDGPVDEDCTCVRVDSATGDDTAAVADMNATPFATIQAAVDWSAITLAAPKIVCVAAGAGCGATRTYAEAIVMEDGVSVYGGYESTAFTRCSNSTTNVNPGVPEGVMFPSAISSVTVLDGFRVNRHTSTTTSAITVDGATNVILSGLTINNTPTVTSSYAINMINASEALIANSVIYAGNGTLESIGVRSVGSTPTIRQNCAVIDPADGHCTSFCGGTNPAIRGRFQPGTGLTYAVLLRDSPGATIEQSSMCGNDAEIGSVIRIEGDADGVLVRANHINAWGGELDSHAIWMEDCGGAAPWILDNEYIAATGDSVTTRVDGIRAVGDCHPVIDSNDYITGGGEGGTSGANGVFCGASGGVASQCVVLGNELIEGSQFGFPPTAVGVRCDDDGCARIAGNLISGRGGVDVWGIYMGESSTVVEKNTISGGCPTMSATGVYAENSFARFENNAISAGGCQNPGGGGRFVGMEVINDTGVNEIDVHSNTIDGAGMPSACTSVGLSIGSVAATAGMGIYRNNIILGGSCARRTVVEEAVDSADPRVFENNNLDPRGSPSSIYFDEAATGLTTAGAVDALTDMTVGGTVSADSQFVNYPIDLHLQTTSQCVDTGTTAGAPAMDLDSNPRDANPDIGAYEYIP